MIVDSLERIPILGEFLSLLISLLSHFLSFPSIIVQVTVEYKIEGGACIPLRVHTIVISVQHNPDISLEDQRTRLLEDVVKVRPRI